MPALANWPSVDRPELTSRPPSRECGAGDACVSRPTTPTQNRLRLKRSTTEDAVAALKTALEGQDDEAIKFAMETLQQASHKLAEEMYKEAQAQQAQAEGAGAPPPEGAAGQPQGGGDDGAVDADFEVVDDDNDE